MQILKKINIDIPAWVSIIIAVTPLLIGGGIAYGQMKEQVDSLQTNFETEKIEINKKLIDLNNVMIEQKIQQTRANIMLELLLQKERISIPTIPDSN